MTCPPFTDLCSADAATVLQEHLAGCPRCRSIVARVEGSGGPVEPATVPPTAPAGPPPRPGGVWAFWAPGSDDYVVGTVLEAGQTETLIIPLFMDTTWAAEEDMVLSREVLGYPALAAVWAGDHVLAEQAVEAVDVLSEGHLAVLATAYEAFFSGEPLPQPGGPPVLGDEDPRIAAHAAIADDLRSVYAPWAMLQVADELGPVVARRRDELGVEAEEFNIDPRTWRSFEAGEADPYAVIPAKVLAHAVRALGFVPSRRVLDLAAASVRAHHTGAGVAAAPAVARRRRGVRTRPRQDPEAAGKAAEHYAKVLAKELGL